MFSVISMKLNINAQTIPRYQTIGIIGIVMTLMVSISGHLLFKNHSDNKSRLSALRINVEQQNRDRVKNELDSALVYIRFIQGQAESGLLENSRERVDQAYAVIEAIYNHTLNKYPESEIKQLICESLRNLRFFHGRGYLFISQLDGVSVLQPDIPELEGQNTSSPPF